MKSLSLSILLADDDPDDRFMAQEALAESRLCNPMVTVEDGEQLLNYLRAIEDEKDLPGIILLDLNMPKVDGREALRELKADARLKRIPVVILTTSQAEEDIVRTYDLGVNSFITKPVTFDQLVEVIRGLGRYWFELVELPNGAKA